MRLQVLSDLHQEFGEIDVPTVDCDLVILAGDVSTKTNGLAWIRRRFPTQPVVYICGNHEFYGEKSPRLAEQLRTATEGSNIHFLENHAVTLGGFHFFGCTLWTNLELLGDWRIGGAEAGAQMNDYKRIRNSALGYRRFTPADSRYLHLFSINALKEFFATHDGADSVIVTHHAPSIESLPEEQRGEWISCAYASQLEELIAKYQPHLWIHGHIHHSQDYWIGRTRVVANPRGYPDQPNPDFQPDLVISTKPRDLRTG